MRKQTSSTSEIIFSIVNLIDKTNRNDNIYFEINNKLSDFKNGNVQHRRPVQRISESDTDRETSTEGTDRPQHRSYGSVSKKPKFLSE